MSSLYRNPIIPGFAPDPSAIFVESENAFFLVTSSFHVYPGLPIYASRDLRVWKHIGNAFSHPDQLSLALAKTVNVPLGNHKGLIAAAGLYAPTLRWHKGKYYIVCTNCQIVGEETVYSNFLLTTRDVWSNEWSDPVFFDFQGIDPSIFFDEETGRAYVQGSWREMNEHNLRCTIRQFEIDIETGRALTDTRQIWEGYAGKEDVEGPHVYKKDGFYYLLAAECGTFEDHAISIGRSTSIWGPYETAGCNPLLTAADRPKELIQNTGHGDLFQDQTGSWWCVFLAVRNRKSSFPMGRESFLAPVTWPTGDWPKIDTPAMTFERDGLPLAEPHNLPEPPSSVGRVYIRNPSLESYRISEDEILLRPSTTTLSCLTGSPTFVGERQRFVEGSATVSLQVPLDKRHLRAGLSLYKDEFRHVDIYLDVYASTVITKATLPQGVDRASTILAETVVPRPRSITFRVVADSQKFRFSYAVDEDLELWKDHGEVDGSALSGWDFTGTIFGVFAESESDDLDLTATFRPLQILSHDSEFSN